MYWKQLEAFFFSSYLAEDNQGDTHTHTYLVKPPRARLLHNICPTFICPDADSQQETDEMEEEGREEEENEDGGKYTKDAGEEKG